jgi:hypothetical protein
LNHSPVGGRRARGGRSRRESPGGTVGRREIPGARFCMGRRALALGGSRQGNGYPGRATGLRVRRLCRGCRRSVDGGDGTTSNGVYQLPALAVGPYTVRTAPLDPFSTPNYLSAEPTSQPAFGARTPIICRRAIGRPRSRPAVRRTGFCRGRGRTDADSADPPPASDLSAFANNVYQFSRAGDPVS